MRWMISEDRLGSDQRDVIEEIGKISDRPIWIQGHAGSGKSVLLLHSLKDYLARKPTAKVCVVVFTNALVDLLKTGLQQIPFLANRQIPVYTIYQIKRNLEALDAPHYDAIFCDEIQDLPIDFISKLKAACTHFVIAGDAAQSIYRSVPVFENPPANLNQIAGAIQPIEKKLNVIYRLRTSIVAMLSNVFQDLLNGRPIIGAENSEIKLYKATDQESELKYCWQSAKEANSLRNEAVAILLWGHEAIIDIVNKILLLEGKPAWKRTDDRGRPNYGLLNRHLAEHGIPLMYIGNNFGSLQRADGERKIVIMTYHSAKGLDFDYVYLPITGDTMFLHTNVPHDALMLVALSRSKSGLTITFNGQLSHYIAPFLRNITVQQIPNERDQTNEILF